MGIDNKQMRFCLTLGSAHMVNMGVQYGSSRIFLTEAGRNAASVAQAAKAPTHAARLGASLSNMMAGFGYMTAASLAYDGLLNTTGLDKTVLGGHYARLGVSFVAPSLIRFAYNRMSTTKVGGAILQRLGIGTLGKFLGVAGVVAFVSDTGTGLALSNYSLSVNDRTLEKVRQQNFLMPGIWGGIKGATTIIGDYTVAPLLGSGFRALSYTRPETRNEVIEEDIDLSLDIRKSARENLGMLLSSGIGLVALSKEIKHDEFTVEIAGKNKKISGNDVWNTAEKLCIENRNIDFGSLEHFLAVLKQHEGLSMEMFKGIMEKGTLKLFQAQLAALHFIAPKANFKYMMSLDINNFPKGEIIVNADIRDFFNKDGVVNKDKIEQFKSWILEPRKEAQIPKDQPILFPGLQSYTFGSDRINSRFGLPQPPQYPSRFSPTNSPHGLSEIQRN